MSKAFVREDDITENEVKCDGPPGVGPHYITPDGKARLQEELRELEADPARSPEQEQRLRRVRALLGCVSVMEPRPGETRVCFGCWVTVEDEDGNRRVYRLVGPDEVDRSRGWLSIESPIARALLGKRAGHAGTLKRPGGEEENFEVVGVAWEPPANQ